jgi:RNA polymerase sigma factor (sigma-70 family)
LAASRSRLWPCRVLRGGNDASAGRQSVTHEAGGSNPPQGDDGIGKYREVYPDLWECVRKHVRLRDKTADADAIAQETMLALWNTRHTITDWDNLRSWVIKVANNRHTDYWRRRQEHPVGLYSSENVYSALRHVTDEIKIEFHEVVEQFRNLAEKDRRLIVMEGLEELTIDEIAEIEGCSTRTVTRNLAAARARLRKLVGRAAKGARSSRRTPDPPVPRTASDDDLDDGEGTG